MAGITRDESFPAQAADLMAMLNKVCEGYDVRTCLMAVTNLQAAGLNIYATAHNMSEQERRDFVDWALNITRDIAERNHNRKPTPTDVPVKSS